MATAADAIGAPPPSLATHATWIRLLSANTCESTRALFLAWPASRTIPKGPGTMPLPH